jgi:hypothetical protein
MGNIKELAILLSIASTEFEFDAAVGILDFVLMIMIENI